MLLLTISSEYGMVYDFHGNYIYYIYWNPFTEDR